VASRTNTMSHMQKQPSVNNSILQVVT